MLSPHSTAGLTAQTLSTAMGASLSIARYQALLPAFASAIIQAGCTTVNRAAMFAAQIGHESVGMKYAREIASGEAYNGRKDLGNIYPGDGPRFKGAGWLQVTGRANFTAVSNWAHSKGYVPTPTFFVDRPDQLASDQYVWIGPVWYWTVARPNLNALSDAKDIVGATRAINGGTNGLADREARWNTCLRLGEALLAGPTPTPVPASYGELMQDKYPLVGADVDIWDVACGSASVDNRWIVLTFTLFAGAFSAWVDFQSDKGGVGQRVNFQLTVGPDNLSPRQIVNVPSGTTKARIGWDARQAQKACMTVAGGK